MLFIHIGRDRLSQGMATELVDVHADLEALRKLYGLLQNSSVDGTQELDERAKIVLKNLLDGATEKALETHTKIITAAQSSVSMAQQQFNIAPNMKKATNCHKKFTSRADLQRGTKQQGSGTAPSKSGAHDGQQRRDRFNGCVKENEKMRESVKSSGRGKIINHVQSRDVNHIAAAPGSRVGNAMAIRRIGCGASDVDRANSRHRKGVGVARASECSLCHNNNNNNNNNNKEQQLVDQLSMKMAQKETVRLSRIRPVPSAKKKLPPPRRQVIVRPTLLEPESESESESDERNGSSASASWATQHSNTTDTDSTEAKSLSGASFAYGQNGDYGSNSETDTKRSGNSSTSPSSYSSFVTSRSRLNPKEDKPAIGRLRRFKNKLALIFHHHHHHHHHHHYDHDRDFSKVRHSHTMWKHIQNNMLHHKNKRHKNEICGKQYFTATKCTQQQQQANYFRTLVQGLLRRQARHSKKSKLPKGGIVVKKLHWWYMFKRRRGLKLGPKTRTIKMK
ncbi:hypothetical protein AB3S75_000555 [Citrus x aurantiifolia]